MGADWMKDVREKSRKKRRMLFSRDSACLQGLLEPMGLQKHRTLVLWAFRCVERPLSILRTRYPAEERPDRAVELCKLWAAGEVKMPVAKSALLQVHGIAREMNRPEDAALCHAVGQACATVHVETHGIGLPLYELTAIVKELGLEGCERAVEERISQYIDCLMQCREEADRPGMKWAPFLLDGRPNLESPPAQKKRI